MTVRKADPDKLRFNFWKRNKWAAPDSYTWEDGEVHYTFMAGYHPTRPGHRVYAALDSLWGQRCVQGNTSEYRRYMDDKMQDADLVFSKMTELTWVEQVYGDCTLENIILTPNKVVLIDPGHPRGLVCKENDDAKLLQSLRGWENVKKGEEPEPKLMLDDVSDTVVAIYITHLYRLLRHNHSAWCYKWAEKEINCAIEHISD
jgi:hypothetical protein